MEGGFKAARAQTDSTRLATLQDCSLSLYVWDCLFHRSGVYLNDGIHFFPTTRAGGSMVYAYGDGRSLRVVLPKLWPRNDQWRRR